MNPVLDEIIENLYAAYTGIEIAESIKRYRQRIELAKKETEEHELLKALTIKHSGMETIGSDTADQQASDNPVPKTKRSRNVG